MLQDFRVNTKEKVPVQARVAVVSFDSLGDSLLYILLAQNLQRNNFEVTYFGVFGYQLAEWIPHLRFLPYPDFNAMDEALAPYDLVLISPPREYRNNMNADQAFLQHLKQHYLLMCQKVPSSWSYDHTVRLKQSLYPDLFESIKDLAQASGSIRFKEFNGESVVDILLTYLQEEMKLSYVIRNVPLTPPPHLIYKRFEKRIIVSPDSAGPEDKNWGKQQFLSLCATLKSKGYAPKIVVSPSNHQEWKLLSKGEYDTPLFEDIGKLAAYMYESAAVVANDSGNGHLASFLGIPVVTIYKKRNPKFHWRPDWSVGKVVCPKMVVKFFGIRVWRPFVTNKMILNALARVIDLSHKST
jgi:heptosyltransferase III